MFAPDGRLELWNRSFARAWNLDPAFLDGHPKTDALIAQLAAGLAKPDRAKAVGEAIRAAALDRKQRGGRLELADGRVLEYAGVPLPDGNGLLTALDVTDAQKAEEALRERAKALEEADGIKTRFLENMSYEFRTPLTSINGFAELLEAGIGGDLTKQGRDYVGAIIASTQRLTEQIETVLDLSQSEAGLLPIDKRDIKLFDFVTAIVRAREDAIAAAGLSLDLRGTKSLGKVAADPKRLGRALGAVLDNAIAATPDGGKILVEVKRGRDAAQIVVSDNGRGMDGRELARALNGKAGEDGTRSGLGLPLARQLVEAHGGTLDLQSRKGAGTTATIVLP